MNKVDWDMVMRTNLDSLFNLCKPTVDGMVEGAALGSGINIVDQRPERPVQPDQLPAAKAGMHGFPCAGAGSGQKGVTVNTVSPGYIGTDMVMAVPEEVRNKNHRRHSGRPAGQSRKKSQAWCYLASDLAGFITGANLAINGGT